MRSSTRLFFLIIVLALAVFISACANKSGGSDDVAITFYEPIEEEDKRLIESAVGMARSLTHRARISLTAEIHVAGDKDSYVKADQKLRDTSAEVAAENYAFTRGVALSSGEVIINIGLHDELYSGEQRDGTLMFTTMHELYHVWQASISAGQSVLAEEPTWIKEDSADLFAWRAILSAFCKPLGDIDLATAPFSLAQKCSQEFVETRVWEKMAIDFLINPTIPSAVELYIVATFGTDAFDRYYALLPEIAADKDADTEEALWLRTLKVAFDTDSLDTLAKSAETYLKAHEEELRALVERP